LRSVVTGAWGMRLCLPARTIFKATSELAY